MSVFILKCLAVLTMIADHVGYVLMLASHQTGPVIIFLRSMGRFALPVFAFLIVNGFEKSSDRKAYLSRLCGFAFISQMPFTLAFTQQNYMAPALQDFVFSFGFAANREKMLPLVMFAVLVYFFVVCRGKWDWNISMITASLLLPFFSLKLVGISILEPQLNVFYTLAVSLAMLCAIDALMQNSRSFTPFELAFITAGAAAAAVFILPCSDYGYKGLLLIVVIYLARHYRWMQCAAMIMWAWWMYGYSIPLLIGAAAAAVPIFLYNGKKGPAFQLGFYLIYPVHLFLLFLLGIFIQ